MSTSSAGSFQVSTEYKIVTVGTTDFTAIGASANTVDTVFTATGAGTGNGTARPTGYYLVFTSAPDAGNGSGHDVYSFTIIKTADKTFLILANALAAA